MPKVYTRTGDKGQTSLIGGKRVPKCSPRLESYGTVDELNAHLGLLVTYCTEQADIDCLQEAQAMLFTLSCHLASAPGTEAAQRQTVTPADIAHLENSIDQAGEGLPSWRGFTLPGGTRAAAQAHVCRTVCRRAERRILALNESEPVQPLVLAYVNRLSDYLYVLACRLNKLSGVQEKTWVNPCVL